MSIADDGNGFTNVSDGGERPLGYSNANGTFNQRGELITSEPGQDGFFKDRDDD